MQIDPIDYLGNALVIVACDFLFVAKQENKELLEFAHKKDIGLLLRMIFDIEVEVTKDPCDDGGEIMKGTYFFDAVLKIGWQKGAIEFKDIAFIALF